MPTINFRFLTPANYAYDSALVEVSGGAARLKDLTPTDETFYASYGANINGSRGGGVLTGAATGGAAVSGGKLDLAHNDLRYIDYDANLNADSQQVGCVKFKFTPNYNTAPGGVEYWFTITKQAGSSYNRIDISHDTGGNIWLRLFDQLGVQYNQNCGIWNPTLGQEYEIELNWDLTSGASRLFIDGVQFGATFSYTFTRDANIDLLRLGTAYNAATTSNFEIDDFQVFSTVQHTANYTLGTCVEYQYCINNPTIKSITTIHADAYGTITVIDTVVSPDALKYAVEVGGIAKYHNGSAWVTSSDYSETNTLAEINANTGTLGIELGTTVKPIVYLHSDTGNSTPEIDNLEIEYDYFSPSPGAPEICIVWGYIIDINSDVVAGAVIKAWLEREHDLSSDKIMISSKPQTTTSDVNGYFEMDLIRSSEFEISGKYSFTIDYEATPVLYTRSFINKIVPDEISKNFWDIVNA